MCSNISPWWDLLPSLGTKRCVVCPFQPACFLSHGNQTLEEGMTFPSTYVSSQHGIMKNTFSSMIWKVFLVPTLQLQQLLPEAYKPYVIESIPWVDLFLSTLHLQGGHVKTSSVNILGTYTYICKYPSCLLFPLNFLWIKPHFSKYS